MARAPQRASLQTMSQPALSNTTSMEVEPRLSRKNEQCFAHIDKIGVLELLPTSDVFTR